LSERGRSTLARYLTALAEEAPVLVLMEDLHWSDDLSLALIDEAANALASGPVLIVATARPVLLEHHPHWGEGIANHRRIWLEPMSKRETAQLVAEILQRADEVPAELVELVVSSAEGNPFYVEELLKWFVEQGVIRTEGARWHVANDAVSSARVPPTLKGVLQARLDSLPPEERALAQRASVVGRVFWDDAVASLVGGNDDHPAATSDVLDRLRSREVVYQACCAPIGGSTTA
jgi:predicted ATPase